MSMISYFKFFQCRILNSGAVVVLSVTDIILDELDLYLNCSDEIIYPIQFAQYLANQISNSINNGKFICFLVKFYFFKITKLLMLCKFPTQIKGVNIFKKIK